MDIFTLSSSAQQAHELEEEVRLKGFDDMVEHGRDHLLPRVRRLVEADCRDHGAAAEVGR